MIGPYFAWVVRRKDWIWDTDFLSHKMVETMGMCGGPGGRLTRFELPPVAETVALMRNPTHTETTAMNHNSIL